MELSNLPKLPGSYNDLNPVSLGWQPCKPTKYPFILQRGERYIWSKAICQNVLVYTMI